VTGLGGKKMGESSMLISGSSAQTVWYGIDVSMHWRTWSDDWENCAYGTASTVACAGGLGARAGGFSPITSGDEVAMTILQHLLVNLEQCIARIATCEEGRLEVIDVE
jgi:hypothetical protein